jgi:hypothetical protein
LTVNGEAKRVEASETATLLDVLRNHLGLMGTRYGCGLEQCGSCMVLVDGQPAYACTREAVRFLGIVDPFLDAGGSNEINKGDRVYIYLKPGSINSLRHEWTHPLIAEPVKMAAINKSDEATAEAVYQQLVNGPAKQLLQNFAADIDISYEELMDAASDYHHHGNYLSDGGKFEGVSIPIGFWDAYQAVTGETVPKEEAQDNFFSCSC